MDKGKVTIERLIGSKPSLFGIPPDMLLPWSLIFFGSLTLTRMIFKSTEGWEYSIGLSLAGCVSWTVVVGRKPYKFLGKFLSPPDRLVCGYSRYKPMGNASIRKRKRNARTD
jgi:hypothetical protein